MPSWTGSAARSSSRISGRASPRRRKGTRSSSSSCSRSRSKEVWPSRPCPRPCRRCWQRASTGWGRGASRSRARLDRAPRIHGRTTWRRCSSPLPPRPSTTHLGALVARGFLRPAEENAFRFRHVIVQEAVYRSAPKRLRAELHERFADRLDQTAADLAELDEFVGYHLERAYRLRSELGESDRRTERLAEDGGHRLGEAGIRALKRGDMPATVNLLERATSLLPRAALRSRLLAELSIALLACGDADKAKLVLAEGIERRRAESRPAIRTAREDRARVRPDRHRAWRDDRTLLDIAAEAIPVFESVEDHRSLGRAWLYVGFAEGSVRGRNEARLDAAERALGHYKRCDWPTETSVGEIAAALYFGPTPVARAIERCEQLLQEEPSHAARQANITPSSAGCVAQRGDFERARTVLDSTSVVLLGPRTTHERCQLRRDARRHRGSRRRRGGGRGDLCARCATSFKSSRCQASRNEGERPRGSALAAGKARRSRRVDAARRAHCRTRRLGCSDSVEIGESDDHRGRRGLRRSAYVLPRRLSRSLRSTDNLNRRAAVRRNLGEVLRRAGRQDEAIRAFDQAVELYEQKGNNMGASRADRPQSCPRAR